MNLPHICAIEINTFALRKSQSRIAQKKMRTLEIAAGFDGSLDYPDPPGRSGYIAMQRMPDST